MTTTLVDTNVLVRYLTDSPPEQAERATNLIEGPGRLAIAPHILAETFFVLTTFYRVTYPKAIDSLLILLGRVNIDVIGIEHEFVVEALEMVRPSKRVSLADELLWAQARCPTTAL